MGTTLRLTVGLFGPFTQTCNVKFKWRSQVIFHKKSLPMGTFVRRSWQG